MIAKDIKLVQMVIYGKGKISHHTGRMHKSWSRVHNPFKVANSGVAENIGDIVELKWTV